ncbi:MAG TPA: hypothetical protein VJH03_14765 [Blastocatellia bacterium]|nr:hypothetical protein [Blastocatellia bacterium]
MKRSLALGILTVALAFACKSKDGLSANGNNSLSKNANESAALIEKDVTITITDDPANPGKCKIALPVPDPVKLKRNQDKVKWCIVYNCRAKGATVTLDNFQNTGDPAIKNPFGDNSDADNRFVFSGLDPGKKDCDKSSKLATGAIALYKYRIRVTGPGGELLGELDPGVEIGP